MTEEMVHFGSQLKVQLSWQSHCRRNLRLVPWHQQFRHREQLSWSLFCCCDQMPWHKATAGRERAYSGCGSAASHPSLWGSQCRNLTSLVTSQIGSRESDTCLLTAQLAFSTLIQYRTPAQEMLLPLLVWVFTGQLA